MEAKQFNLGWVKIPVIGPLGCRTEDWQGGVLFDLNTLRDHLSCSYCNWPSNSQRKDWTEKNNQL